MMPRIALFIDQPRCSTQCGNAIMHALETKYTFKIFTKHEVESNFFDDVDIVAFPGGTGDADYFEKLLAKNGNKIRNFIARGGRYLGICMGAYWAGKHYFDILNGIDAVQYITRPHTDTRRPHAKAIDIKWDGENKKMFFYDGCALVGNGKFETVATYANGDKMAGYQNRIGLIGCHPESEPSWYTEHSWMHKYQQDCMHHDLLLDFVDRLMLK